MKEVEDLNIEGIENILKEIFFIGETSEPVLELIKNKKVSFNENKFPNIDFYLSADKFKDLESKLKQILKKDTNGFAELEKTLLAFIWKQGDYQTLNHFIKGIMDEDGNKSDNKGPVMYQFGKHIKDYEKYPIIDQHVIRAYRYSINTSNDIKIIDKILNNDNISSIVDIDKIITDYTNWYQTKTKGWKLEDIRMLDKYIFSLGKQLKEKRNAAK